MGNEKQIRRHCDEIQESTYEKKEAKKAWDKTRDEKSKKMYKEKTSKAKKELRWQRDPRIKICMLDWKQKEIRRSCTDWLSRETEQGKMYSVRVVKDEHGNIMVSSEAVLKRWKEYFENIMYEKNDIKPRTEEAEVVNKEINCVSREEVKNALRRI